MPQSHGLGWIVDLLTLTTPASVRAYGRPSRWLLAARAFWFSLGIALAIKTIISPEIHTVYTAFSGASRDWWANHSLYSERAYYYSPAFAVALTPLAVWSDRIGGILWAAGSIAVFWIALRQFYRIVLPLEQHLSKQSEGKFLLIVLLGSVRSFWSSQSNALLVALVLLGMRVGVGGSGGGRPPGGWRCPCISKSGRWRSRG